jgi:hypothetical protein
MQGERGYPDYPELQKGVQETGRKDPNQVLLEGAPTPNDM